MVNALLIADLGRLRPNYLLGHNSVFALLPLRSAYLANSLSVVIKPQSKHQVKTFLFRACQAMQAELMLLNNRLLLVSLDVIL